MILLSHLQAITERFALPHRPDPMTLMDLGLTKTEFDILQSSRPETREQMVAMAEEFGVSAEQLASHRWRELDLALTCTQCTHASACLKHVRAGREFARENCPNAALYCEIATA